MASANRPIVTYVKRLMNYYFPTIQFGGYNSRTTAMGSFSFHAVGLAADLHFNVKNAQEEATGEMLFYAFIRNATIIGIDHIIWNRRIWSKEKPTIRPYTGGKRNPHTNHVHIAFLDKAGNTCPPILEKIIRTLALDTNKLPYC
jgi:hypothetical protein